MGEEDLLQILSGADAASYLDRGSFQYLVGAIPPPGKFLKFGLWKCHFLHFELRILSVCRNVSDLVYTSFSCQTFVASNAILTIDNEMSYLIIFFLNCI